ncbi:DUF2322 family protein [Otariodibacter oris]|uniref:DUF2322 family protein n=1 Tax=Otariodibacter oris TaxID=1032623 RepID=A0A420XFJ3_9PAST|nr:DUF2322 family protein [Otariodibacter oris]QGM80232.1 hypothetical protein A6A10_01890 [Otariodibacter oris]RKR71595.1 hypothetical protein DES31_1327 [Otariodibacter oris]
MKQFQDYLATFPSIEHLNRIDLIDTQGTVAHSIPAIEGKLGSLKLYNALALKFHGELNRESAQQGLLWFAELVEDAQKNIGKHPNIDLLLEVVKHNLNYRLQPISK